MVDTEPDAEPGERADPTEAAESAAKSEPSADPPSLGSRILVTWAGLTTVGVVGGLLSATVEGPVGFIVYLSLSLASVAVLLYNVNELVKGWVAAGVHASGGD